MHIIKFKNICLFFLLTLILAFVSACSSSSSSEGGGDEEVTLSISSHIDGNHSQFTKMVEPLMEEIEEETDGRITVDYHTGGALGKPSQDFDIASSGTADISIGQYGYTPNKFPLAGFNDLPFLGDSSVETTELAWDLYEEFPEFGEELEGTKVLWLFKIDPYQIFTTGKKVEDIDDVKNLKIRTPTDEGSQLLENLGANPVSMDIGDIYEGMNRGTIDGALLPASTVINYQLYEVTDYIIEGNFMTVGLYAVMNQDTWDNLSEEDQEVIDNLTGEEAALKAAEVYDADGEKGWEQVKEEDIEIYELDDQEKEELEEEFQPMYDDWINKMEGQGLPGQDIYDRAQEIIE